MWGITRVYSGTVTVSHIHNLFLYADDSCFVFQGKDIIQIEKQLKILQTSVNGLQIIDLAFTLVKIRLNLYFLLLNVK